MRSVITGMGMYLPEQVFTSDEVELRAGYEKFGIRTGLVKMLTGCASRHYAAEGEYSSHIAARAGQAAMDDAGIIPADIDAVLFCSITQDFAEPATVNVVMDMLDIRNAYSFDIKNACNAFLSGLDVADSLIASGKVENVLLVSGEALSRWTKFDYDDKEELLRRGPAALSVGDGGGAFVVSRAPEDDDSHGIVATSFHTIPAVWNNNVIWGGGVMYPHAADKLCIPGTTKALIDMHQDVSRTYVPPVLERSGWVKEDVDCVLVSQVAKWITKSIRSIVGVKKEVMPEIVETVGNVGAANIPIMGCEARRLGILKPGSKTLMLGGAVGANVGVISVIM